MVDECGVPVRLMTIGRMSTSVHGQCWRMSLARGGVFVANQLRYDGEVVVRAVFSFPYLNLFSRRISSSAVRVSSEFRFEESDEVRFVSGGT
jgi:hypothetical protein